MSGGPVFNGNTGNVCGVVCSGVTESAGAETFTSHAALIRNIFSLDVMSDEQAGEKLPVSELVRLGVIGFDIDLSCDG